MKKRLLFALIACASWRVTAWSEGGCPPGQYPQQGQGWQACVPIPGSSTNTGSPKPQWIEQWQAIATDAHNGVVGVSKDKASPDDSVQAAISDCKSKGGINCRIEISFGNGCVAMVFGNSLKNTQGGETKEAFQ